MHLDFASISYRASFDLDMFRSKYFFAIFVTRDLEFGDQNNPGTFFLVAALCAATKKKV